MESLLKQIINKLDALEGKLQENTDITTALLHQSEVQKAQIDAIVHATASS